MVQILLIYDTFLSEYNILEVHWVKNVVKLNEYY